MAQSRLRRATWLSTACCCSLLSAILISSARSIPWWATLFRMTLHDLRRSSHHLWLYFSLFFTKINLLYLSLSQILVSSWHCCPSQGTPGKTSPLPTSVRLSLATCV